MLLAALLLKLIEDLKKAVQAPQEDLKVKSQRIKKEKAKKVGKPSKKNYSCTAVFYRLIDEDEHI